MLRALARSLRSLGHPPRPAAPRPLAEHMEPRLLYSADFAPGALLAAGLPAAETRSLDADAEAWLAGAAAIERGGEILFVDAGVDDAEALIAELSAARPWLEVVRLEAGRDGLEQIREALTGRSGLAAVHIVSHGEAGRLYLGNAVVDATTLAQRAAAIEAWAAALGEDADILLYGCDVAAGADGERFIDTLARLSGADVAASTDRSGAAALGGNWVLERHTGRIEATALASGTWQGSLGVSTIGGDIAVNTTTANVQNNSDVALLDNGNWMVVWEHDFVTSGKGIVGRLYDAAGNALTGEFVVNVTGSNNQTAPAIATDGQNGFVVAWVSDHSGNRDIYARRFDTAGNALGGEFLVNSGQTAGDQWEVDVAMNAAGAFVIAWSGQGTGDPDGIHARRYDSAGNALGGVLLVNSYTSNKQLTPSVAIGEDGRFVVAWMDEGQNKRIIARQFDAAGAGGSAIAVQTVRYGDAREPDVAIDAFGNFAIVWDEKGVDNDSAVMLQRFDAAGGMLGGAIKVNVHSQSWQQAARIAMNARGDFVVAYESDNLVDSADKYEIALRSFEAGGVNAGPELRVNSYYQGSDQRNPALALNRNGQIVVTWEGQRTSLETSGVQARRLSWPEGQILNLAPVLDNASPVVLAPIDEDAPTPTGAAGWSIVTLVSLAGSGSGPQNVSDADAGAVTGIALTAAEAANGQWRYSTNSGSTWTLIDAATLSATNALLLAADGQTRLHYTPNADTNGTLATALSFRAWDRSSGSNGSFASTTANGGSTAFSTATGTATLTVNAVNDVPVITVNQLTIAEGASVVLNSSMLNATDVESGAAALTYSVVSVSGGFFALGAAPTIAITSFTQAQVNAGSVVFTHDGNEAAPAYSLTVSDPDGGTSAAAPATIGFTNVNDAPTILGSSPDITVVKLNGAPSGAVGVTISSLVSRSGSGSGPQNIGDSDAGALTGIAITAADTSKGTWWYSTNGGTTWTALGAVSGTSARLLAADGNTRLYFQETLNSPGTVANSLSFRAWDRSSGANGSLADASINGGSTAFSANTGSVSLNVQFINIAPTLTATGTIVVSTLEDAPDPTGLGAVGFLVSSLVNPTGSGSGPQNTADVDGDSVGVALVGMTQSNGSWWFSIDGGNNWSTVGSASTANALLLANDVVTRLYYQPGTANDFGTAKDSLTFRAWDGSAGTNGGRADTTLNGGNTAFSTTTDSASLTITAVNDVPAIGTNQLTIAEGATVILNGTMLNATDVESGAAELTYSVVSVSGGFFALGAAPAAAISSFTQAQVNAGSVIFTHDGNEAAPAYTLTVRDGDGADSAASPAAIGFTNVNDAPTLAAAGTASLSVDEDHGAPVGDEGAPVSALVSLAGSGSGPQNVADADAAGLTGIAIIGADTTNGSWFYSIDGGASWNALGTVSTNNARLLSAGPGMRIAFQANPDYNGTTPDALRFLAWDQTSGSNGGTADTSIGSAFSTASDTLTLIVRPANDAPTVAAPVDLGSINEDGSLLITQAALLAGAADIDGDGLTAINLDLTAGSGSLVDNGNGTWTFTPSADWNGAVSFDFEVSDGTVQVANSASLSVTAVNDAPAGADKTVTVLEDGSHVFALADFGFTDASDSPANTLLAVKISTLPGAGTLTLDGAAVTAGDFVSATDIAAGKLRFAPAANANGTGYAGFTFQVQDNGGTANGGVDLDPTANTLTIDVTAVNDAPAGADKTVTVLEDGSYTFTTADFGFTDASDSPANTLLAVKISTLPGAGTLTLDGAAVTAGDFVSATDIAAGKLRFAPAANANGTGYAGFMFQVRDNGGIANGGVDLDPTPNTITIDVTAVNDAPTVTPVNLGSINEDGSRLITQAQLLAGAADVDGDPLSAINLALTSGSGTLIDNLNGTWTFVPTADWNGTASFAFAVSDGTTSVANTATLGVLAVNDAPTVVPINLGSTPEDGSRLITQAQLLAGAADVDGDPLSAINLALTGGSGNLINNGNGTWTFTPASDWHGPASFGFAVSDGTTTVANTATLLVSGVNDAPIIVVNRLVLAEGQTVVVTGSDLRGIDVDTPDSALTYSVSGLSGGYFALAGAPAAAVASFTQAQVNAGDVRFVHDGGEAAPAYVLSLSDGSLSSAPSAASIGFTNVNDAPSVSTPANQSINVGAGFGPVSFTIGDAETAADALQVSVRSSNQAVLPDAALRLSGSGASRSLSVLAGYAGVAGSTSVIIEVSDGSATTSTAFTVSARALPPAAEPPPKAAEPAPEPPAAPAPQAAPAPAAEPPVERPAPAAASAAEPVSAADERVDAPVVPLFAFAPPTSVSIESAEIAVENIVNVGPVSITLSTADVLALMYTAPDLADLRPLESEMSRSLRESRLDQAFSQLRDAAHSEERGERQTVAVATVTGAGLTIGYVAWVIRGGVLVSSLLTTMPAWRLLDPLPILDGSGGDDGDDGDDGDNDDSLQSLVEANAQHHTEAATAHDAGAPVPSLQEESPR